MKRDMDLVREILLQLENSNAQPLGPAEIAIEGRTNTEVSYHIELLHEAGLLEARNWSSHSGHDWRAIRLTWWGHEFLDAARSDTIWREAK